MRVTLVSNTGPLIGLAKLGQLDLLTRIASSVAVPPQVQAELLAKTGPESARLTDALRTAIRVLPSPVLPGPTQSALLRLDEGERQAIALAHSLPPPVLLLLDDQLGRKAARRLGQPVTGLAGLLVLAKRRGLIERVTPLLLALRHSGYWMSDEIVAVVGKLANE